MLLTQYKPSLNLSTLPEHLHCSSRQPAAAAACRPPTSVGGSPAALRMEPECIQSHRKCNWDLPSAVKDVVKPRDVRYAPVSALAAAERMACEAQQTSLWRLMHSAQASKLICKVLIGE